MSPFWRVAFLRLLLDFWKICVCLVLDQFEDVGVDERVL
jgi:hypothetical protein